MRRSGVTPPEDACMLSLLHVHYPNIPYLHTLEFVEGCGGEFIHFPFRM